MTYSSCLRDQQDLRWGNTSRDTSEESQESQDISSELVNLTRILSSEPATSKNCNRLLSEKIIQLERNAVNNAQYNRREIYRNKPCPCIN